MPLYMRQKEFTMKKFIALMLVLALSLALVAFSVSCKSCNDSNTDLPGGVENPGGNLNGGSDENDNNDSGGNDIQGEWIPIG